MEIIEIASEIFYQMGVFGIVIKIGSIILLVIICAASIISILEKYVFHRPWSQW